MEKSLIRFCIFYFRMTRKNLMETELSLVISEDKKGNSIAAMRGYTDVVESFIDQLDFHFDLSQEEKCSQVKEAIIYLQRAESLQNMLQDHIISAKTNWCLLSNKSIAFDDRIFANLILMPTFKNNCMLKNSDKTLDDIVGQEDLKMSLKYGMICPLKEPQLYQPSTERPIMKSLMLFGPSNDGLMNIAMALGIEMSAFCNYFQLNAGDLFSQGKVNAKRTINNFFKMAEESSPCFIHLNELDVLCKHFSIDYTDGSYDAGKEIFMHLDDISYRQAKVFIVASTADPCMVNDDILKKFLPNVSYLGNRS